jgi:Lipocalin-like domain
VSGGFSEAVPAELPRAEVLSRRWPYNAAMHRRPTLVGTGVLAAVVLSAGWLAEAGQDRSQAELRKPLVGTWRLVSIEGGSNAEVRGSNPTGIIVYDAHGNMAAQIQPDRQRPKYTGPPTPEQALERMRGYTAYFGTYTIQEQARTVTHHRQGMLDAGAVDFVRSFTLSPDGNRITLTPVGGTGKPTHLTWERVR